MTELARNLDANKDEIHRRVESIEAYGLAYSGWGEVDEPAPRRQYLCLMGRVDAETLGFLPMHIDDLNARRALLKGGIVLVDEFRQRSTRATGGSSPGSVPVGVRAADR